MSDEAQPGVKRFRLTGPRFDGGRLPVDSLIELQRYQDVVRIAAQAEWRDDHPGDEPPKDFSESVSLTIERIDEGSADVILIFEPHAVYQQYQVEARDAADAVMIAAYSGDPIPELPALPPEADREFREVVAAIGSTLEPGQSIEFYPDAPDAEPITITIETRKAAIEQLARIEDFLVPPSDAPTQGLQSSEQSLTGRVTAINADKQQFWMQTESGEIHGWYRDNPELLEDFRKLVNSAAKGPLTRVTGDLQIKLKNGEVFRFRSITRVEQVQFDDTPWGSRLTEFASLPPGWDGGEGAQITSVALDAAQMILRAVDGVAERPGVFPTDEGGVLIEWAGTSGVRSAEVLADGTFELFSLARGQQHGEHATTGNLAEAIAFLTVTKA